MAATVRIEGLQELIRALERANKDAARGLKRELREAGQIVSEDARARFSPIYRRSAMGMRPRVRGFGTVVVEQRYGKTTGFHPEYGALQMRRAFIPALWEKAPMVNARIERMLDNMAANFN